MAFDAHKNLAIATVTTATGTAGTTLGVTAGQGARFPAVPFNATVWPFDMAPDPTTAEVVRVTARATDTLTITRAQEGTTARAIVAGDLIAATITAKSLTDIESGANFPLITTPGAITAGGEFINTAFPKLRASTVDGADNVFAVIASAGSAEASRGAFLLFGGNESVAPGQVRITAGNLATGGIWFLTGNEQLRGQVYFSGGLAWGGTPDPGLGNISAVAFVTGSDARLKHDRGPVIETDVLARTVIHDFEWIATGLPGRGVFAQEAAAVAPFAVTVGTDETDEAGNLTQPWGVDYAKYVPDLIVGWQAHDAQVRALEDKVARLEATVDALLARLG